MEQEWKYTVTSDKECQLEGVQRTRKFGLITAGRLGHEVANP